MGVMQMKAASSLRTGHGEAGSVKRYLAVGLLALLLLSLKGTPFATTRETNADVSAGQSRIPGTHDGVQVALARCAYLLMRVSRMAGSLAR